MSEGSGGESEGAAGCCPVYAGVCGADRLGTILWWTERGVEIIGCSMLLLHVTLAGTGGGQAICQGVRNVVQTHAGHSRLILPPRTTTRALPAAPQPMTVFGYSSIAYVLFGGEAGSVEGIAV